MTKIALLPILPGDQHGLTPVLRERDGSALVDDEIIGLDLTPIDQGQSQSIRQHGAQFLHHVQRQTRTPRTIRMEEADLRIEPHAFQTGTTIMTQHRSEEHTSELQSLMRISY